MGKRKRSKQKPKDSDKNLTNNKDQDYVDNLSDNSDTTDEEILDDPTSVNNLNHQKSTKPSATSSKFQFDPNNISKSALDLINFIEQSSIAKRAIRPIVDSIQTWLEIYNIQSRENLYLTETNNLLTENNKSLQNAINCINQTKPKTFAEKVKSSHQSAVQHVERRQDNTVNENDQLNEHARSTRPSPSSENNAIWKKFNKKQQSETFENKNVFIVESEDNSGKTTKEIFSSLIDASKLKLKIDRIVVGRQNRAVVYPKDDQQIKIIREELEKMEISQLTLREPKERLFKIHINNVDLDKKDDYRNLNEKIVELNEELNLSPAEIKPLFAHKNPSGTFCVVFGVNSQVRKKMLDIDRVYIGFSAHKVYDYFEPMMCYRCNKYGHSSTNCQTDPKTIKCTNCSSFGHPTNKCAKESVSSEPYCPSCNDRAARMKISDRMSYAHWPGSAKCPSREIFINREKEQLKLNNASQ